MISKGKNISMQPNMISKREPRLLGEVIRDLIERGQILPFLKSNNYGIYYK